MKYCTNCGRQLADDEVCTCRQQAQPQAPNQTQDNNAQADNAAHQHSLTDSRRAAHRDSSTDSHRAVHRDSSTDSHRDSSMDSHRAAHSRRRLITSHSR